MSWTGWKKDLLDVFLPPGCAACRRWVGGAALLCERCRTLLRQPTWPRCIRCHHPVGSGRGDISDCLECRGWPEALTAARYAYVLEPPAADLVHALKYEGWPELAELMGAALTRAVTPGSTDLVVPVPTTRRRLAERGYNQAERLARVVAAHLSSPLVQALDRRDGVGSQTALTPEARRENVRGVFVPVAARSVRVSGADVLLVDDVLTTGATAAEAALVLARLGAASVTVGAFARALPSRRRRAA